MFMGRNDQLPLILFNRLRYVPKKAGLPEIDEYTFSKLFLKLLISVLLKKS